MAKKIRIEGFHGVSSAFANMTEGSEHEVVTPPEEYKKKYPNGPKTGYWVMGVGEPIRVLPNECRVIE